MKIICNNIIPFKGFAAINLFGVLFIRKNTIVTSRMMRHEEIHTVQMKELWYVGFYLLYVLMWLKNLLIYGPFGHTAYRNIAFEKEAYDNENNFMYLGERKKFAWIKSKNSRKR